MKNRNNQWDTNGYKVFSRNHEYDPYDRRFKNLTPLIRMLAMPSDTNPSGDIFGGWLMSLMDLAAANKVYQRANGRVAKIAVNKIEFHKPVAVGDLVTCFADITHLGRTSLTTKVEDFVGHDDVGSDF